MNLTLKLLLPCLFGASSAAFAQVSTENLSEIAAALRKSYEIPAAAIVVVRDGEPILVSGLGEGITSQTRFLAGSISKTFTALAIALESAEGRIDLDQPLIKRLPKLRLQNAMLTEQLSWRDLLTHRSGFGVGDDYPFSCQPDRTLDDLASRLRHLPPPRLPFRAAWNYSNLNYELAGYALSRVVGKPYETILREVLFEPLGMKQAGFGTAGFVAGDHAIGHEPTAAGLEVVPIKRSALINPAGGLYLSAEDMAAFLSMLTSESPALPAVVLARLSLPLIAIHPDAVRPVNARFQDHAYGLGTIVLRYRGRKVVGHEGQREGYHAQWVWLPEERIGIAVLGNVGVSAFTTAATYALLDALLEYDGGEQQQRWLKSSQESLSGFPSFSPAIEATRPLTQYIGSFEHSAYGPMEISLNKGILQFDFGECQSTLTPVKSDTFEASLYYPAEPMNVRFIFGGKRITAVDVGFDPNQQVRFVKRARR